LIVGRDSLHFLLAVVTMQPKENDIALPYYSRSPFFSVRLLTKQSQKKRDLPRSYKRLVRSKFEKCQSNEHARLCFSNMAKISGFWP
jgi:hypothetical protein